MLRLAAPNASAARAQIIEVPRDFHHPVAQHHDHVRHLTLFRRQQQPGEQQRPFLGRDSRASGGGGGEHEQGDFGFNFLSSLRTTSSSSAARARASVDIGRAQSGRADRSGLTRASVPINSYAGTSAFPRGFLRSDHRSRWKWRLEQCATAGMRRRSQQPSGSLARRESSEPSVVDNLSFQRNSLDGGLPRGHSLPPVREQAQVQAAALEGDVDAPAFKDTPGRQGE